MHKRHVVAFAHIQVNCTKLRHTANLSCSTATDVHGIVCIALDDVLHMLEELLTSGEHAVMQNKAAVNFPDKKYDEVRIRGFKTIEDFAEDSKSRAKELAQRRQLSRYIQLSFCMPTSFSS